MVYHVFMLPDAFATCSVYAGVPEPPHLLAAWSCTQRQVQGREP